MNSSDFGAYILRRCDPTEDRWSLKQRFNETIYLSHGIHTSGIFCFSLPKLLKSIKGDNIFYKT